MSVFPCQGSASVSVGLPHSAQHMGAAQVTHRWRKPPVQLWEHLESDSRDANSRGLTRHTACAGLWAELWQKPSDDEGLLGDLGSGSRM
jgi:hypothetical protein